MEAFIALDRKKGTVLSPLLAFPKFSVIFFLCLVANSFFSVQLCVMCLMSVGKKSSNCPLLALSRCNPVCLAGSSRKARGKFVSYPHGCG